MRSLARSSCSAATDHLESLREGFKASSAVLHITITTVLVVYKETAIGDLSVFLGRRISEV